MTGISVELVGIAVDRAVDRFCGRPKLRNPYHPISAIEAYVAWDWGWDEAAYQLEMRGAEEAARWLREAA